MKSFLLKTSILYLFFPLCLFSQTSVSKIIPLPNHIALLPDKNDFVLNKNTLIVYPQGNEEMKRIAEFLAEYIKDATGINLNITHATRDKNAIILLKSDIFSDNDEAYQLLITQNNITISANTEAGIFYGIQTLRKAVSVDNTGIKYAAMEIKDKPRFGYRGAMLDIARHFQPVEFVKKFIDILALHNINTFHWHLSDDQGWRIEIKKYPLLTSIGSVRKETAIGKTWAGYDDLYDGIPHSGYYTQEQIKDVINYAKERYITIIPEIDMPGHMLAAMASYPNLGCKGTGYEVLTKWGISKEVLCAGKESTYIFVENVLSEIIDLFPSKYIHIGGDECPKVSWEACPHCQQKIRELNLTGTEKHKKEFYLQSYFTKRVEQFVNSKGRRIIGWDEILEGEVAPNATIMSWRGVKGGIEAANLGHDVIMAPYQYLYFDYYQSDNKDKEPLAIGGHNPVERVYGFEPLPDELSDEAKKHILGVQANLWTEYISNSNHVEYMLLPRMAALSEIQWTEPEKKDYKDFLNRLPSLVNIYDIYGYKYARHVLLKK